MANNIAGIFGVFITFGVAILVHEFGHFLMAKLSGVGVETFCIGFGKKIVKVKLGETTYAIGWIPFGGYVQLKGAMSKEMEEMFEEEAKAAEKNTAAKTAAKEEDEIIAEAAQTIKAPEKKDEPKKNASPAEKKMTLTEMVFEDTEALRTKPAYVKIAVFGAGVFFNYLTALLVLTLLFWIGFHRDKDFAPILGSLEEKSYFEGYDIKDGDKVITANGQKVETFTDIRIAALSQYSNNYEGKIDLLIKRDDKQFNIKLPVFASAGYTSGSLGMLSKDIPPVIADVKKNSPAEKAGFIPGDTILKINNSPVKSWADIAETLLKNKPEKAVFEVNRKEKKLEVVKQINVDLIKLIDLSLKKEKAKDSKEKEKSSGESADSEKKNDEEKINNEKTGDEKQTVSDTAQLTTTTLASLGIYSTMLFDLRQHIPPFVGETVFNKPAEKAGIRAGDYIVSLDGVKMNSWYDFVDSIQKARNRELTAVVKRGDKTFETIIIPQMRAEDPTRVEIGIIAGNPEQEYVKESFRTSITSAPGRSYRYVELIVTKTIEVFGTGNFKLIKENIGGPVAIGVISYKIAQKDITDYFFFFVIFNLMLMVMNLLPIPVMDGGHIFFTIIESIIRRPLPAKALMKINVVFISFLIGFALLVTFNDIIMNFWRLGFGG